MEMLQGVRQRPQLPVELPHVLPDLGLGVQQLDRLGVGVVARGEVARDRGGKLPGVEMVLILEEGHIRGYCVIDRLSLFSTLGLWVCL